MRRMLNFLLGVLTGALLGWMLAYLRFPLVGKDSGFQVGFLACLTVVSFAAILIYFLGVPVNSRGKAKDSIHAGKSAKPVRLVAMGVVMVAAVAGSFLLFHQYRKSESRANTLEENFHHQLEILQAERNKDLFPLVNQTLASVNEDLKNHADKSLRDETIAEISKVAYTCKPYRYLVGDSLSEKKLSPERAHLLLMLVAMGVEPASFTKIKSITTFASSDLRGADLSEADLSGIDLREADLFEAKVIEARLDSADLEEAVLWGADLHGSNMVGANLKRTDLRWANLDEVILTGVNLSGTDAGSATFRKARLDNGIFRWGFLTGAAMNEAKMTGMDLHGTRMERANFTGADLSDSNLRMTTWPEANLRGAELYHVLIRWDYWFQTLQDWKVIGLDDVKSRYHIVPDTINKPHYTLEPVSH